jgi:hypothetical protein
MLELTTRQIMHTRHPFLSGNISDPDAVSREGVGLLPNSGMGA